MTRGSRGLALVAGIWAAAGGSSAADAADPPAAAPVAAQNNVQLSVERQHLSAGFGPWYGASARGNWRRDPANLLQWEVAASRRYGVNGLFGSIGVTHVFDEDWFGSLALGAGDGAFYLPRVRVDGTISRKFLAARQLVGTLGAGYYRAPDGHTDRTLLLGMAYYFTAPWVVEAGIRFNRSNPGSVQTHQKYIAATYGRAQADLVSARYGWGGEGYLAVAGANQLVNFRSNETTLAWQHWVRPRTGFTLGLVRYSNPLYRRTDINLGLFHEF